MNDQHGGYARLRYTATGALAALAAVGAIAGTIALAASPRAKTRHHAAAANGSSTNGSTTKVPTSPAPGKTHTPQPVPQVFLTAIEQLVDSGTITATEAQTADHEILAGRIDTDTLTSSGFTQTQLQAIEQALNDTKRALGPTAPPPTAPGRDSTPQQEAKHRHS
jgi:hypothetical protein